MRFFSLAWIGVAASAALCSPAGSPPDSLAHRSSLPSSFSWTSSQPYIWPKDKARGDYGIKDPSVIFHDGKYHVFASTAKKAGYSLVYLSFADWSEAESSTFHYLDMTPIGKGYRAAPQVFYHSKQKIWYLVYQAHGASFSTNSDITNPDGWTAPQSFYTSTPALIQKNMGRGQWVDMWTICESKLCHMFSSDDNGNLYRAETSVSDFPKGFGEPTVVMHEANMWKLYEASCVYNVGGSYLLIVEAAGNDGWRYFRSWTSNSLSGQWKSLASTEQNPFIRSSNVKFADGKAWTKAFSHGEVVRSNVDETMTIDPCKMQFLYQGYDPSANGVDYNNLPYKLALLTQEGGC
ncbi:hypothetical protein E4U54_000867 [Claviceps lovelessii]|nr:hypothetical protein E4U54_000867 [Claviceps lovelessii]